MDAGGSYLFLLTHASNYQFLTKHEKGSGNKVKYPVKEQKLSAASRRRGGKGNAVARGEIREEAKATGGRYNMMRNFQVLGGAGTSWDSVGGVNN